MSIISIVLTTNRPTLMLLIVLRLISQISSANLKQSLCLIIICSFLGSYREIASGPSIWESVMYDSRLINRESYGKYVSLVGCEIILDNYWFSFKSPDSND